MPKLLVVAVAEAVAAAAAVIIISRTLHEFFPTAMAAFTGRKNIENYTGTVLKLSLAFGQI